MKSVRRPKRIAAYSKSTILGGLIAFVIVLGAAVILMPRRVESNTSPLVRVAKDFDTVLMPVPIRGIAKGERLTSVEFVKIKWPKNHLTEQYVTSLDENRTKVALSQLPAYLPVPTSSVGVAGLDSNAVVEKIPEGMRAITVKVDPEAAIEGWAQSGNFVDVMVIRKGQADADGIETQVIAENVRILSAGRSAESSNGDSAPKAPGTITLLVNQEDVLKIKTAANIGKLTFSLRGAGDEQPTMSRAMNQRQLLGAPEKPLPARARYRGYAMGPDGRKYVLGSSDEWIQSSNP